MSRPGPLVLLGVLPVLVLGLTACGSPTVARDTLEDQVTEALQQQLGAEATVSCPGDLQAEVEATTVCTATEPDGDEFRFRIEVTAVEDEQAEFSITRVD